MLLLAFSPSVFFAGTWVAMQCSYNLGRGKSWLYAYTCIHIYIYHIYTYIYRTTWRKKVLFCPDLNLREVSKRCPVNWASGIPLQDEGIRAGVTVESLGKLKACDMQIGRKKNAWNPTARARVLAWWRRAAKSYCAIPSICPPVMRCINISSTRLLRRMFGEDSAQKKNPEIWQQYIFQEFFCGRIFFSATWGFHWSAFLSEGLQWASSPLGFGSSGCWFYMVLHLWGMVMEENMDREGGKGCHGPNLLTYQIWHFRIIPMFWRRWPRKGRYQT